MKTPIDLSPTDAHAMLERQEAVLVDVREPFEHRSERIPGALPHPLGALDLEAVRTGSGDRTIIFQCRSGRRSRDAVERAAHAGLKTSHLEGGIEAWKQAGLEVERPAGAPVIDVMRQVQIAAGSLVLLGVGLGLFLHPGFFGVSAFVGAGLVFAGLSGFCGMARLLGAMPWNRPRLTDSPSG